MRRCFASFKATTATDPLRSVSTANSLNEPWKSTSRLLHANCHGKNLGVSTL